MSRPIGKRIESKGHALRQQHLVPGRGCQRISGVSREFDGFLSPSLHVGVASPNIFSNSSRRYGPAKDAICNSMGLTDEQLHHVLSGTAQALFGSWTDGA